jgi:hypothetical protein
MTSPERSLTAAVDLLEEHFARWSRDPSYLGLTCPPYTNECPPLLFIGGAAIPPGVVPLIVVSFEPLLTWHFPQQVEYARRSVGHYVRWNTDFARAFPQIAGERPQAYWAAMGDFVHGWAAVAPDRAAPWPVLGSTMLELPFVPMHARSHVAAASMGAAQRLRELFVRRVEIVLQHWPRAAFVVLGAGLHDRLRGDGLLDAESRVELPADRDLVRELGPRYLTAVYRSRLLVGSRPTVFLRRGPFSRFTNPRSAGRKYLGTLLRALHERP